MIGASAVELDVVGVPHPQLLAVALDHLCAALLV